MIATDLFVALSAEEKAVISSNERRSSRVKCIAGSQIIIDWRRLSGPKLNIMTVLLVCGDEQRLNRLKAAIHSAGFRTFSARSLDEALARTYSYDLNAVVIDHELKNDIAAPAVHHTQSE